MSDPAVEAARRAWAGSTVAPYPESIYATQLMESAAREALTPIRELHKPTVAYGFAGEVDDTYCESCAKEVYGDLMYQQWPCATARLVYTTEELGATK